MRILGPALVVSAMVALCLVACDASTDGDEGDGDGSAGGQVAPGCGNGVCGGENCQSCPQDCGQCPATCGDEACTGTENCLSCPRDCPESCVCGDSSCTNGVEDCVSCATDCGACPAGCPDGDCDEPGGETCLSCAPDCGACPDVCGDGPCGWSEDCSICPQDCGACSECGNVICELEEDCNSCEADCGICTWCGDTWCDWDEDCNSCSTDCGACTWCGDDWCDWDEDCDSCPADCGQCQDECEDGIINNDETDYDCGGGTCPPCPDGWYCLEDGDCISDACLDLVCFPCDSARLAWNAPTTYTDGTCLPITELYGFNVYYGTTAGGPYPNVVPLSLAEAGCFETADPDPSGCGNLWECSYTVDDLSDGTWYFSVSSVAIGGAESEMPPEVSKTFDCY